MDKDVTSEVSFSDNDGDSLPLLMCVCGKEFDAWDFVLGTERDRASECHKCHHKLYFTNTIAVFEVIE
jgi:hypothetical protein